jgi:molybdate transport system substrate-binding protein
MGLLKQLSAIVLGHLLASAASAEQIHAAVAANFLAPFKEVVNRFEHISGHRVIVSSGSSGKIFAQIQNGAPFQVFLSADQAKPEALEKAGLAAPGSRFTYATGTLVLWSTRPGFVDEDFTRLKNRDFNKLALANPRLAPYGAAAVEVLENLKLEDATRAKWVQGESIAQTYQFVASGNADLGFVALSQIMNRRHIREGSSSVIPDKLYSPIRQDAVLLKSGKDNSSAKALLNYLRSEEARGIILAHGYKIE